MAKMELITLDRIQCKWSFPKVLGSVSLFSVLFAGWAGAEECQNYQDTQLVGTLVQQTFAGPPNYESIADGDKAERYFLIKLAQPVCINADRQEPSFSAITEVQLVLNGASSDASLRSRLTHTVRCKGKLFSALTGHHHTQVLLSEVQCE